MPGKVKVFISYSHQDERYKDALEKHLGVAADRLEVWSDRRIVAGADWLAEIKQALAGCRVALLLISADFLTSPFILGIEVPALLRRREKQGLRVIPVIVQHCIWDEVGWLKPIQARPLDGVALADLSKARCNKVLADLAREVLRLSAGTQQRPARRAPGLSEPEQPPVIDIDRLPAGTDGFFGRVHELSQLDRLWQRDRNAALCVLVAPGGTGKTALVQRWLARLRARHWCGAQRVFGWSFYSQGQADDRQVSEEPFLAAALAFFGVSVGAALPAHAKGERLADAIAGTRTLLILDGLEPLQDAHGRLHSAEGLKRLLGRLLDRGQPGLCVITTRLTLDDLADHRRSDVNRDGNALQHVLDNLDAADAARLLYRIGVRRAGGGTIAESRAPIDLEWLAAGEAFGCHALSLSVLGRYLTDAHQGDVRHWREVKLLDIDPAWLGDGRNVYGHAFRAMQAYERWLASGPDQKGTQKLAVLRLLGLFDRPATPDCLRALLRAPVIDGLT
ncbi:MAG TPA: TIR domain-containing protein, partial [Plasticicumulans sp.]|nr:TIR domain-containing protein [Plasticicumulans sp.]